MEVILHQCALPTCWTNVSGWNVWPHTNPDWDILKLPLQRCELKRVFLAAVYQPDMMPGCRIYNLHLSFKYECIETQRQNISFSSPVKSDFRAFCAPLWVHWHSTGNCKHSHWINYQLFPPRSVWLLWKKGRLTVLNFGPHVESPLVSSCKENEREQVPGEQGTHEKVIFRRPRSGEVNGTGITFAF